MLYKFKSKATGDLIMLEPSGRLVLQVIGKEPGPQGIIEVHEMMAAIAALQQAIAQEQAQHQAQEKDKPDDEKSSAQDSVGLKQRALPFIDMLQRAHAEKKDIVWGV
jgi:cyclopropane-fatty-acyl-phospholipid synthase